MSNALAIAAVTSTLRYLLEQALGGSQPGPVGSAAVTTLRPEQLADADAVGSDARGINVYLYRVTPNHAWNLTDLPTRRPDGTLASRPMAALDLHYLVTCYGDDVTLDPQRLLGRAALALAVTPVLGRDLVGLAIEEYRHDTDTAFLADADLAGQVELVKLSPTVLSLEDLSRLWGVLGTPYLLSVTYTATVVLLEAELTPAGVLPVRRPVVSVAPIAPPRLAGVDTEPPGAAIGTGSVLRLRGSGLLGRLTAVQVGPAQLGPGPLARPDLLTVTVQDTVPAGVHAVQVVLRAPGPGAGAAGRVTARSNSLPVLVRPAVSVTATSPTRVTLSVTPPLFAGQQATVTLSPLPGSPTAETRSFTLTPVAAGAPPSPTVVLARSDVPDGAWLVRISVDGAESLPELDGDTYGAPALRLP